MIKAALLDEHGYVKNVIILSSFDEYPDAVECPEWVGVGMHIYEPSPESKPTVPTSISPRQIRQALTRAGLRPQVEAAVAAGDQDLKDWWEFSTTFERHNPQVDAMRQALVVTDEQVDQVWMLGASL